jgi:ADP-ribose pyrophosphatase YjhB (NUDIX family)
MARAELSRAAVAREMREEIGTDLEDVRLLGVLENASSLRDWTARGGRHFSIPDRCRWVRAARNRTKLTTD